MGAIEGDRDARDWEKPRHEVTVGPFRIDRHEVTVTAYAAAVEAGVVPTPGCSPRTEWGQKLCNWGKADRQDHPVNGVSWEAANAYCHWKGKRLPTEAEFEMLLRQGDGAALYPWGDALPPPDRYGNFADVNAPREHAEGPVLAGYDDGQALTAPVASFAADTFGVHDVSGNIWEWCSDWFDPQYYGRSPATDPAGPDQGQRKILKGGNFFCIREELRISERHHKKPTDEAVYTGFRCAADATSTEEEVGL